MVFNKVKMKAKFLISKICKEVLWVRVKVRVIFEEWDKKSKY